MFIMWCVYALERKSHSKMAWVHVIDTLVFSTMMTLRGYHSLPRWGIDDRVEDNEKNDAQHACCPAGGKSGVGMFLLLNRTSVLLVRKSWSCYWPSIYVDEFGEEDVNMRRGMPLMLSPSRASALWKLYVSGNVADAVTQKRVSSDRVLRRHWY